MLAVAMADGAFCVEERIYIGRNIEFRPYSNLTVRLVKVSEFGPKPSIRVDGNIIVLGLFPGRSVRTVDRRNIFSSWVHRESISMWSSIRRSVWAIAAVGDWKMIDPVALSAEREKAKVYSL
jgi:hypothetical protein